MLLLNFVHLFGLYIMVVCALCRTVNVLFIYTVPLIPVKIASNFVMD